MTWFLTVVADVVFCWTVGAVVTRGIATPHAIIFWDLRLPIRFTLLTLAVLLPVISDS